MADDTRFTIHQLKSASTTSLLSGMEKKLKVLFWQYFLPYSSDAILGIELNRLLGQLLSQSLCTCN